MFRFCIVVVCSLLLFTCTPKPAITAGGVSHETCPPVSEHPVDTLGYTVTFSNGAQREQFVGALRSFLNEYPFSELREDTVAGQVVIRIAPVRYDEQPLAALSPVEQTRFSEGTIEQQGMGLLLQSPTTMSDTAGGETFIDTVIPRNGGSLRLYTQRSGIDNTFLPLVTVDPFAQPDSTSEPLLTVSTVSPKKITLHLNGRVIDGAGRVLSALDLIDAWTGFVKKHPAEGLALFRHVEGIREFIAGREAVIRGIGAVDQNTCYLRLNQSDTLAARRIATRRLCGSVYSKIGLYYPAQKGEKELILLPNLKTGPRRALLDTLVLSVNDDKNPILSFSLKKYDVITLIAASDVSYARSTLEKQASLQLVSNDRYFISCSAADGTLRRFVASRCNGADLLHNSIKGNGKTLAFLETDSGVVDGVQEQGRGETPPAIASGQQVRILFRNDDIVSGKVAEKLLADLSGAGMRCVLAGQGVSEYERSLVERKYDCAVGWVPEQVLTDESERLRLATVWFGDNRNEADRIAQCFEIPLFSIERYLLIRKPAGLYHNRIDGLFALSKPVEALPLR